MRGLLVLLVLAANLGAVTTARADSGDFDIPPGHWFTQTNGFSFPTQFGYGVYDLGSFKFWSEFQRLGGVPALGYPVSRAFPFHGYAVQGFQKALLQWRPETGHAVYLNVFDLLHDAGKDAQLQTIRQIPPPADTSGDAGKSWDQVVAAHQAMLNGNAAIKAAYFADPDPISHFGLPMTGPVDEGNVVVVRCQRAAFQQWKAAAPWAAAGQVTIANGGDLAKEAGLIPLGAALSVGPSTRWSAVQAGPDRVDTYQIGLDLSDLPPGYTFDVLPPAGGSDAGTAAAAASTANLPDSSIVRGRGPFDSYINPGLVNYDYFAYVKNQSAQAATGAVLIESLASVYDSVLDAQRDYEFRVGHMRCCATPVSLGPIGDGGVGGITHAKMATGVPVNVYGVVYHQANITGAVIVSYVGDLGSFDLAVQLARASIGKIAQAAQAPNNGPLPIPAQLTTV